MRWLLARAESRDRTTTVAYLNAHTFNMTCDDADFRELLRAFDMLYPDGQAIVWASRRLAQPAAERINAADFIGVFFEACARAKLSIALIGGKEGEAETFAKVYAARIPDLNISYSHHGYFDSAAESQILNSLREANPEVVLIGMGSPLQERFAARASQALSPRLWWCVGALFEYDSGSRARAPRWMRTCGLEWLFRLALEPRRMWKRYIIGNPKFVARILSSRKPKA